MTEEVNAQNTESNIKKATGKKANMDIDTKSTKDNEEKKPNRPRKQTNRMIKVAKYTFTRSRLDKQMKLHMGKSSRISNTAPIFLSILLEYIMRDIISHSSTATISKKRKRVKRPHLAEGIKKDPGIYRLIQDIGYDQIGMIPILDKIEAQ
jgi:histone H3/H4